MKRIGLVLALLVSLAAPAWADFQDGVAAYRRGDYATAFREFLPLAEQGDARAQLILGGLYHLGQGVSQDYAEAMKWYRKAAEQGNASAQNNLGLMYSNGRGVPQDHAEAAKWYRKAAEQGDALAQINLGLKYDKGQGVPQDYAEAIKWFRKAAEQGQAQALEMIAGGAPEPSPSGRFPRTVEGEKQCTSEGWEVAVNLKNSGEISPGDLIKFSVGIAYVCEGISDDIRSVVLYAAIMSAMMGGDQMEAVIAAAESLYAETYEISDIPYKAIMEK